MSMRHLLSLTFILLFFLGTLSLLGFFLAIHPFKIVSSVTPTTYHLHYENISFKTSDNILIRGWFIPSMKKNAATIVLLHGYPADKGDILPSRIFLHKNYNLLFFDFRYLGESEGRFSTVGKNEILDLIGALDYLNSRGINDRIGVWGWSLGGSVALMTAAQDKRIKALVVESPYARLDWIADEYYKIPLLWYPLSKLTQFWAWLFLNYNVNEISALHAVKKIKIPILLIYSKNDLVIPERHGAALQNALSHNKRAKFIVVDRLDHGVAIENEETIVNAFFAKNL